MALTEEHLHRLHLMSDLQLYDQAVKFTTSFGRTISSSQLNGLMNITKVGTYSDVREFVAHQQDRTWPDKTWYRRSFYAGLAQEFRKVEQLAEKEFRLKGNQQQQTKPLEGEEIQAIMVLLFREFVQHLAAQNGYLEAKKWIQKQVNDNQARGRDIKDRRSHERTR